MSMTQVTQAQAPALRLEELVRELEVAVVQAAQEMHAKLHFDELFDEDRYYYRYVRIIEVNPVGERYTDKIADAISNAVYDVLERHSIPWDVGECPYGEYIIEDVYPERTVEVCIDVDEDFFEQKIISVRIVVKQAKPHTISKITKRKLELTKLIDP